VKRTLSSLLVVVCFTPAGWAQTTQTAGQTTPAGQRPVQQAQPWKQIPIPPLPAFHPEEPTRVVLANGPVLLLEPDHELPFITGFVEMRGGGDLVPDSKTGLEELYGEAWRTSGTAAHSGDQMDDILEAKAAKVETGADVDSTSVSWTSMKGDFDQVFGLALDLLEHPQFRDDKLALAKQQMAAAIVRRNDDPGGIAAREAAKLVYGAHSPYGRTPELATMLSVTVADLQHMHDQTVMPNNMIIGIEGDFDPSEMERKLRAAFEGLPKGTPPTPPRQTFPGPSPGVYAVDKTDVNQSNVWIVGLGTERNNPDYYALSVMNYVFSGGFGSRLFQEVRTKLGLAYSVDGAYGASYDHPGMFYAVAATKSGTTVQAAQAMLTQIRDLKTRPFTDDELRRAKDQVLNSFIFRYDTPDKVLGERAKLEFYGYPADFLERYRTAVEKVTTADLERVAQKYVDPSRLAVLVVGNEGQFSQPLSTLGAVHPVDITIPMPPGMMGPPGRPGPAGGAGSSSGPGGAH
jgi:zinc protease